MRNNAKKKEESSVLTKETLGVVLVLFASLCLICLISRDAIFSVPGLYVNAFLLGVFGYFAFAVVAFALFFGVLLITGKKVKTTKKRKAFIWLFAVLAAFLLQTVTMRAFDYAGKGYGEYLSTAYSMGAGGIVTSSGGGVVAGLIGYLFPVVLGEAGSYVVITALLLLTAFFFFKDAYKTKENAVPKNTDAFKNTSFVPETPQETAGSKDYPIAGVVPERKGTQRLFVIGGDDFALKTNKDIKREKKAEQAAEKQAQAKAVPTGSYSSAYGESLADKLKYITTPAEIKIDMPKDASAATGESAQSHIENETPTVSVSEPISTRRDRSVYERTLGELQRDGVRANDFDRYADIEETEQVEDGAVVPPANDIPQTYTNEVINEGEIPYTGETEWGEGLNGQPAVSRISESPLKDIFAKEETEQSAVGEESLGRRADRSERFRRASSLSFEGETAKENPETAEKPAPEQPKAEEKPAKPPIPINREYFKPPIDLLETNTEIANAAQENHEERERIIEDTLADFRIEAKAQSYIQGPTITRYELSMPAGVSVKKVLSYDDDLRMRLASKTGVRIEAPIPGKNLVGIEVANNHPVKVGLREVLEGGPGKCKPGSLMFAIGKNIVGQPIFDDLALGPHFLVAGTTGSGKSVCLNVMIVSLIMRYSPEELRLILVDPKGNEFIPYEHMPHLLIDEIITEPKKAVAALDWAKEEMERRYQMLRDAGGVRDITSYNETVASDTVPKMARIVIVVDELSNLMESCKRDLEARILSIAQKARAIGIHLVLATQRPSVDVITGVVKANLPSRIGLKVTNAADSGTILGVGGAEKLLGYGDMLYKNSSMGEYERYQGSYISDREIHNVVTYIKENNKAYFDDEMSEFLEKAVRPPQEEAPAPVSGDASSGGAAGGELFEKAVALAITNGSISISLLQRRFQIGYARAGGLVDKMERSGYISPNEGSKARDILITREQFEEIFGHSPDD